MSALLLLQFSEFCHKLLTEKMIVPEEIWIREVVFSITGRELVWDVNGPLVSDLFPLQPVIQRRKFSG